MQSSQARHLVCQQLLDELGVPGQRLAQLPGHRLSHRRSVSRDQLWGFCTALQAAVSSQRQSCFQSQSMRRMLRPVI